MHISFAGQILDGTNLGFINIFFRLKTSDYLFLLLSLLLLK